MIKKWDIVHAPRPDDQERYKILVEGDHTTIIRSLKKIDHMFNRPVCGRPFGQMGAGYNWAFYIYNTKLEERNEIEELLKKIRDSEEEALIIEKAAEISMAGEEFTPLVQEEKIKIPVGVDLNERFIFDNFLVAQNNHFAQAAALAVAESPGRVYNPLFIYGKVGLGKTHLMQAIGHSMLKRNPQAKVVYTSTEKFIAEVINAIRDGKIMELRDSYRVLDLLLVDDVQFLSEAEAAQEEFFHTFNALYDAHKQIVLTSDKPPKKISVLEERLRSRFEWGLIADLQTPNLETRVAILQKKAQMANLDISNDVLFYIAEKLYSNIRELEGFLIRIAAYSTLTERELNKELAEELIKDLIPPEEEEVVEAVDLDFSTRAEVKEAPQEVREVKIEREAEVKGPVIKEEKKEKEQEAPIIPEVKEVPPPEEGKEAAVEEIIKMPEPEPENPIEVKPVAPVTEKTDGSVDMSLRVVSVGYFYPEQKENELKIMERMFEDTLKKHKIKFRMEVAFEKVYQQEENATFQPMAALAKEKNVDVAIALGPSVGNLIFKENMARSLVMSFEKEKIHIQIIPFKDVSKQYRYLDVCLDLAFLKK
jgi:chromosomal replication initiator protein DnaA